MTLFTPTINGEKRSIDVSEKTPLLFVLRNDFALQGAKLGCGHGNCGACTVLVDGRPANACTTPMWEAGNRSIETVEGYTKDDVLDVFLDLQAAQCGYCIPGIMMTVRGMLHDDADVTREQIIEVLAERHLCRCGTHHRILKAIDRLVGSL